MWTKSKNNNNSKKSKVRYSGFFNVNSIDLKLYMFFHKLFQNKIKREGRARKSKTYPFPRRRRVFRPDGESRGKDSMPIPSLSIFSVSNSFERSQGTFIWNWNPWHLPHAAWKWMLRSSGLPAMCSQGWSLMDAMTLRKERLDCPETCPPTWLLRKGAARPKLSTQKTFGVELTVLSLRATCLWVTEAFASRCYLCLFLQRRQIGLEICFPFCSQGMFKRAYFVLLKDLGGKQRD